MDIPAFEGPSRPRLLRALLIAIGMLAATWLVVAPMTPTSGPEAARFHAAIDIIGALLAVVVGVLLLVRYRWSEDVRSLWIGAGMIAHGAGRLVPRVLVPMLPSDIIDLPSNDVLLFAGRTIALMALIVATGGPGMTPRTQLRRAIAATAAILAVVIPAYTLFDLRDAVISEDPAAGATSVGHLIVAALLATTWLALAFTYLSSGLREVQPLPTWLGLCFLVQGSALLTGLPISELRALEPADVALLRTAAFICALIGVITEMRRLYTLQTAQLHQTQLEAEHVHAQAKSEREAYDVMQHEARNALQAIDAGVRVIEMQREALPADQVAELEVAVQAEIGRLQRMLGPQRDRSDEEKLFAPFRLANAIRPAVASARVRGADIRWDRSDAVVRGQADDVTQIVHNLVQNAITHAPGAVISVRLRIDGGRAFLYVADSGPGIPPQQREAVFERGFRGAESKGNGLGLAVSRELATAQGAELSLEEDVEDGATFRLALPLASRQPT